jgi:hypothetical protein
MSCTYGAFLSRRSTPYGQLELQRTHLYRGSYPREKIHLLSQSGHQRLEGGPRRQQHLARNGAVWLGNKLR